MLDSLMGFYEDIDQFKAMLPDLWSPATLAEPKNWNPANPSADQCSTTSLLAQDLFGGEIVRVTYHEPHGQTGQHYLNILPGDIIQDFTASQFQHGAVFTPQISEGAEALRTATQEYLVSRGYEEMLESADVDTMMRHDLLSQRATSKAYKLLDRAYDQLCQTQEMATDSFPEPDLAETNFRGKQQPRDLSQKEGRWV